MIEANPTLKEDHCMGVILATFPLTYTAFDNSIAAGKLHLIYIILYFYIFIYILYYISQPI